MNNAQDIDNTFGTLFHPTSALVFYQGKGNDESTYVEHFDMDRNGNPINAHPLTVNEGNALAKSLRTGSEMNTAFLKPKGILPTNILHINPSERGSVLWHTKEQQRQLFFVEDLGIPNGKANVPPMLWHADKSSLTVFALATARRPTERTPLYYAPFFNIYEEGRVCMGTVNIDIKKSTSVEEFIQAWEHYFFNSYFSHLLGRQSPIKGNCVAVWKQLVGTDKAFPKSALKKKNKTLKNLL